MLKPLKDTINLKITNKTALPQSATILGGTQDVNAIPATILYSFDLSREDYLGTQVSIQVMGVSPTPNALLLTNDIDGVTNALNTLGYGLFYNYGGSTVYISSNQYVFGTLTIV